jgi:hypothetical protein
MEKIKVKDFKKLLELYNEEDIIVMSSDGEGNNFSPFSDMEKVIYVPINEYSGEIYNRELTKEMRENGWSDEDLYDGNDGINAIVLYPIN